MAFAHLLSLVYIHHDKITCSPRQSASMYHFLCITMSIWVLMRGVCNSIIYGSRGMRQNYDSPSLIFIYYDVIQGKLYIEAPPRQDGVTQINYICYWNHISPSSVIGPGLSSTSPDLSNKVIMSARDLTIIALLMEVSRLLCSNIKLCGCWNHKLL